MGTMRSRVFGRLCAVFAVAASVPPARPQAQTTVRATVREVVVDFVARDKRGRIVRDLKPDELEVLEDGTPQKVKSFRLAQTVERGVVKERVPATAAPAAPAEPAAVPLDEMRIVSIVFDRLGAAANRTLAVDAAREFLANENAGSTYVGLFVLDARLHVFQPYTTDRDVLRRKLDAIATAGDAMFRATYDQMQLWIRNSIGKGGPSGSITGGGQRDEPTVGTAGMTAAIKRGSLKEAHVDGASVDLAAPAEVAGPRVFMQMFAKVYEYEDRVLGAAYDRTNLLSLTAFIREQAGLPGRKTMLIVSEGMKVPMAAQYLLRTAVSEANRANVSIYTLDSRGLAPAGMTFEGRNDLATATAASASMIMNIYANDFRVFERSEAAITASSQEPMRILSEGTGGFFTGNTNDVRGPIRRMVEEIGTQWVATYSPSAPEYDGRFRSIEVRVRRPGLTVQARKGYYAVPLLPGQTLFPFELALLDAIRVPASPRQFEFHAKLAQFRPGEDLTEGVMMFEVARQALTLAKDSEGGAFRTRAAFLALIEDAEGRVVEKVSRDIHLRVPFDKEDAFRRGNLIFAHPLRLPPGDYRIQAAAMDGEGRRLSTGRVSAHFSGLSGLAMSEIILARQVEGLEDKADPADPLQFEDKAVTPAISSLFRKASNSELSVYCVLYPPSGGAGNPEIRIEFFRAGEPFTHVIALVSRNGEAAIPHLARFKTSDFEKGRYEVAVTATCDGASVQRKASFTVE